jgi:hypothetical protein
MGILYILYNANILCILYNMDILYIYILFNTDILFNATSSMHTYSS